MEKGVSPYFIPLHQQVGNPAKNCYTTSFPMHGLALFFSDLSSIPLLWRHKFNDARHVQGFSLDLDHVQRPFLVDQISFADRFVATPKISSSTVVDCVFLWWRLCAP